MVASDLLTQQRVTSMDFWETRFWKKVDKSADCWIYKAAPSQTYGVFKIRGNWFKAHRLSYEIHFGPITEDMFVCHHCDTPRCVNPSHLFLGTAKDNSQDMVKKGRSAAQRGLLANDHLRGERHWCHVQVGRQSGEFNHHAILTSEQVSEIRKRYQSCKISQHVLAKEYGIAQTTVSAIIRRVIWPDI